MLIILCMYYLCRSTSNFTSVLTKIGADDKIFLEFGLSIILANIHLNFVKFMNIFSTVNIVFYPDTSLVDELHQSKVTSAILRPSV